MMSERKQYTRDLKLEIRNWSRNRLNLLYSQFPTFSVKFLISSFKFPICLLMAVLACKIALATNYPNLHGDLSAGSGFNAISRDPEFGFQFMEEFQDRLYWGTDIADSNQNLPIIDYFRRLKAETLISREAHEKITWKNANRLLDLGLK